MSPRIDVTKHLNSGFVRALLTLSSEAQKSVELSLFHLIEIRASQINGCASCIDMHTKEARAHGETEQRIYALDAWRETPFYTDRERAALEWTEAVTRVADTHVPDDVYAQRGRALQRGRARGPDRCRRRHQQLEPPVDLVPSGRREL